MQKLTPSKWSIHLEMSIIQIKYARLKIIVDFVSKSKK